MNDQPPPQPEPQANHRYLRVGELAHLRHHVFSPRRRIEGQYAGRHATPQRGHAIEFNDYREYVPGDTLSDIDWKVFARSDRLYIKQFEHQADMTVNLLIDASASMNYPVQATDRDAQTSWLAQLGAAGRKVRKAPDRAATSKYDQACLMAAAIAFLTIKQQDRVALGIASAGLRNFVPAGSAWRQLHTMLRLMEQPPAGKATLSQAIPDMLRRTHRRGIFVIFTDLLDHPDTLAPALTQLTHRGMEVVIFHIQHPDEQRLPDVEDAIFVDSETGQRLRLNTGDLRQKYQEACTQRMKHWHNLFRTGRGRIDYQLVSTQSHYSEALRGYLINRATMQ